MPRYADPASTYASRFSAGVANTGLVGTVRFRLIDADSTVDDPVYGPSTDDIVEDPTGSGDYMVEITLPPTQGTYFPAWDLGSGQLYYDEDVVVTRTASTPFTPSGNEYVTRAELKAWLNISSTAQDDQVDLVVEAASRAIDDFKKTRFYPSTETRYYSPDAGDMELDIDDLVSLTSVKADRTGDGTFEETWTENTDFVLSPLNNTLESKPKRSIILLAQGTKRFPGYERSIQVVGSFGWATTPAVVRLAATMQAARYYERRNSPLGILSLGGEGGGMRLGRLDPDVAAMLENIEGQPARLIA
jgi:hypothetical protein